MPGPALFQLHLAQAQACAAGSFPAGIGHYKIRERWLTIAPFPGLQTSIGKDFQRQTRYAVSVRFFPAFRLRHPFSMGDGGAAGVPVPSLPLLLAAGTLTATHKLSFPLVLIAVVAGCLQRQPWYLLGKRFGGAMVKLVCRLSFERSTCVRKTEDYFTKYGEQALLVAKFVPGWTVAAPIAGQTGMRYRVFLAYDLAGALFWAATLTLTGRFFGDVLRVHPGALSWMEHSRARCSCWR